jgi:hypothetical protein
MNSYKKMLLTQLFRIINKMIINLIKNNNINNKNF